MINKIAQPYRENSKKAQLVWILESFDPYCIHTNKIDCIEIRACPLGIKF